jgi:hypothetical protein
MRVGKWALSADWIAEGHEFYSGGYEAARHGIHSCGCEADDHEGHSDGYEAGNMRAILMDTNL